MRLTNIEPVPEGLRPVLAEVCGQIGPEVLGARWPADADPAALAPAQVEWVFEQITREFWRQQIQRQQGNRAAEVARAEATKVYESDPFG